MTWLAVGMGLLAWFTIALAEPRNGPTCDEYRHVTRGVAALRAPDTRINRPHPPLAQALAMLPVALTTNPRFSEMTGWAQASMVRVTSAYTVTDYARGRRRLRAGRLMNAAWSGALLVFLVCWLRRRFDDVTAVAAGALYATCPIILAHAGLVTNDFAVGAFTVLSLAALLSYLDKGGWWRLLLAALAVAALPAAKVSGILVVLLEATIPLFWLIGRRGAYAHARFGHALLRFAFDYVLIVAVVLLLINAIYRFQFSFLLPGQLGAVSYRTPGDVLTNDNPLPYGFLKHWPTTWRVPVPMHYLNCLSVIEQKNEHGHMGRWFGERSGSWLYFPFMLATKPQALLLPLVLTGFALNPREMLRGASKWLLLVGLGFLLVAMKSNINIGVRHVLPMLMALLVLGGRAASVLLAALERRLPRSGQAVAVLGAASLVAGVLWAFPAFVGDFNVWVGNQRGRRAGAIAEDWGQDVADLARELKRRDITRIGYAPRHSFASIDLNNSGISVNRVGCNVKLGRLPAVAVHLALWDRSRSCYKALRNRDPDFTIHDNILVFLSQPAERRRQHHRRHPVAPAPNPEPPLMPGTEGEEHSPRGNPDADVDADPE